MQYVETKLNLFSRYWNSNAAILIRSESIRTDQIEISLEFKAKFTQSG